MSSESNELEVSLFPEIAHPKKRAFLAAFIQTASVTVSAKLAEIDRRSHYVWKRDDEVYLKAFESARLMAAETLEAEAIRRAHDGVDEPQFYKGEICGHVRRYSDVLLIFLLKGAMPDKYKERQSIELGRPSLAELLATDPAPREIRTIEVKAIEAGTADPVSEGDTK